MSISQIGFGKHGGVVMISCGAKEGDSGDKDDGFYMRRCVELARKAIGCTSPNPMVGCVIVKAGQPHAEVTKPTFLFSSFPLYKDFPLQGKFNFSY
jgi:diaminohydroxyphosphoribosylaminopyrimidine deaminase/5-amino-6-(5-phosphoribosylamino)uracil reductase